MRNFVVILALVLAGCVTAPKVEVAEKRAPVILVSIDGMRPDYLQRGVTPNLNALAARGVRAEAMRPSFPSLTFPNHYTIVTGMRPDRHGVVGNTMEDPAIPGVKFTLANREAVGDRRWWDATEPVWVTAEKAGVRTATMFWPGSDADIGGVRPSAWKPFDGTLPEGVRVDTVLGWLDAPQRPGFLTLYFDTVDHDGHEFGPDAAQTTAAVAAVDMQIGRLLAGLTARGIEANIVVVSDHGMTGVAASRRVLLDGLMPAAAFRLVSGGAVAGVEAAAGQEAVVAAALLRPHDHMQCWRKGEIPARLAFGRNRRVPAIVCMAELGWMILASAPKTPMTVAGMHGYDPAEADMAATFVAAGPGFRTGVVVRAFDNVDVYPMLMELIGVPARESDGNAATLAPALR